MDDQKIQCEKRGAADLNAEADDWFRDLKTMEDRHVDDPEKICVALDPFASRIPDQAVAMRKVFGIAHRNHLVVRQREIADAVDEEAGPGDKQGRVGAERADQGPQSRVGSLHRNPWASAKVR